MDNTQFGAFIAQLRKEMGLTQKELADRLNVTDKAVSKWETAKGFPDVKLLERLADVLGVSLVELMQGKRQEAETLTVTEAVAVVSQAMDQSEKTTARRYLQIFRWFLIASCTLCLVWLCPQMFIIIKFWMYIHRWPPSNATEIGVIGGVDGPTAILTASHPTNFLPLDLFLQVGIPLILIIVCVVLAIKVWQLEKRLK